ncbi:MAG TPA: hypothetical protein VHL57_07225, partial [Flavobacteriales bacterium]|nr:hypothetical protein [Flavobacteriales bacterium]
MGRAIAWIHDRTRGRRWPWIVLVLAWMAASLVPATRLRVQEDLFAALPEDDTLQLYRSLLTSGGLADRILVGFTAPDPGHVQEAVAAADSAALLLQADS